MKTIITKLQEVANIAPEFSVQIGNFSMRNKVVSLKVEMKNKHIQFLKENGAIFDLSKKEKPTGMNGNEFILNVKINISNLEKIQKFNGNHAENAQLFSFMNNHSLALLGFPFNREGLSEKGVMSRFIKFFPKASEKMPIRKRLKLFKKEGFENYKKRIAKDFYYA